jgi:hypothetical protein
MCPARTPDGVVNVRPKAVSRPRKATGLLKLLVRSPPSSAASHPDGAGKSRNLRTVKSSMTGGSTVAREQNHA